MIVDVTDYLDKVLYNIQQTYHNYDFFKYSSHDLYDDGEDNIYFILLKSVTVLTETQIANVLNALEGNWEFKNTFRAVSDDKQVYYIVNYSIVEEARKYYLTQLI